MKLVGTLLAAEDMGVSRRFYEELMGQIVQYDFGANLAYESGLSLQHKPMWAEFILAAPSEINTQGNSGELYFEEDDLAAFYDKAASFGVTFVHGIKEHDWGQRVLRLRDPDGHIIEVGEPMEAVVRRLIADGFSPEETAKKTMFPLDFVMQCSS